MTKTIRQIRAAAKTQVRTVNASIVILAIYLFLAFISSQMERAEGAAIPAKTIGQIVFNHQE